MYGVNLIYDMISQNNEITNDLRNSFWPFNGDLVIVSELSFQLI